MPLWLPGSDTDSIHDGLLGRPSQMTISDGFNALGLLVLSTQILSRRWAIGVDLEVMNQKIFELVIGELV